MEALLKSNIKLDITLYSKTPIKKASYTLNYKCSYGRSTQSWSETLTKPLHQSKAITLDYLFSVDKQDLILDLECVMSDEAKSKRSFVSIIGSTPPKIRATFNLQECLRSQKPLKPYKLESKTILNVEEMQLMCGVKESRRKGELQKIRFDCRVTLDDPKSQRKKLAKSQMTIRLQEMKVMNVRRDIVEYGKHTHVVAEYDEEKQEYRFPYIQFMSDLMSDGPVIQKLIAIQIIEMYQELNKKTK